MKLFKRYYKIVLIFALVYLFLLSIKLIGTGTQLLGRGFAEKLIATTTDPFVGLFIGLLVTAIIQSSSVTTSLVVALVGGGVLELSCAIPIIMGANIGTTVTHTIVALGYVSWRQEFRRAFAAGTVHDFYKILAVIILFPLELKFKYLTNTALFLEKFFGNLGGLRFTSPVKTILSPVVTFLQHLLFQVFSLGHTIGGIVIIIAGLSCLIVSLVLLVKNLRKLFVGKAEVLIDRYIFGNDFFAMGIGFLITAIAQSSSLTISIMIPLAAAGVLSLGRIFVYTMGASVGTTVTCLLASLAIIGEGRSVALAAAAAHLLFNLSAIAIFYPIKRIRNIPVYLAGALAYQSSKRRYFAFIYVFTVFILVPLGIIILRKLVWR